MKEYFAQNQASDILHKLNLNRLSGGKTCDIQLKCGEEKFHVQKNVLSQVSEYFEKLFYSEMKEKYQDSVELHSIGGQTLKTILDFVYTAKIIISTNNAFDILTAANYLLIEPIQEYCCNFILESLDFNNSVQVWLKVQKFDINTLAEGCDEYLKKNFNKLNGISTIHSLDFSTFKSFVATRPKDAKGEERAFRFTVTWVKHDLEERKHLFPQLFELIDLNLLSHEFVSYNVANENLMHEFPENVLRLVKHMKHLYGPRSLHSILVINKNSTIVKKLDIKEGVEKEISKRNKTGLRASFVVYKNHLYMLGGSIDGKISDSVTRLDLRCQCEGWENQPPMKQKRRKAGVYVIGDVMFVFGGNSQNDDGSKMWLVPEKLKLNDKESKWLEMNYCNKGSLDLVACKDMLYALHYGNRTCEKYDAVTEAATMMHKLPKGCVKLVAMKDQLYVICRALTTLRLSKFDPESGESHDVSKIENVGEVREACAAYGEIILSYVAHTCPWRVCISAYNFDDDKWRLITESEDRSNYWKLVTYENNPFE